MIRKKPYEKHRKTIIACVENDLVGSDEWRKSINYFQLLNSRNQLPFSPCAANGYLIPSYSEALKYNEKENPRKIRRIQSEEALREAMLEAGITEEKINSTFEILERMTLEKEEAAV